MNGFTLTLEVLFEQIRKWTVSVIVLFTAVYLLLNRGTLTWIDNADLIFHEAGHFFFMPFGRFFYTLGGTLMQLIIPAMLYTYFHNKNYRTGAQVLLLWLGQNLINISVYAADARAKQLPLLGGRNVYHDWNYLLNTLGMLSYDQEVGYFFVVLASLTFLMSVLMPLIIRD